MAGAAAARQGSLRAMIRLSRHAVRGASAIAAVLVVALLGACSGATGSADSPAAVGDQSVPLADLDLAASPRTVEGPSTALLADSSIAPEIGRAHV